ncbi:gamma-aminobutyric acid receptor subunit alpha-4 isoform X6 [Culex quinquefasciatus]|uniref:gamma-aminobutyric acid receptor subunit alpha-4 isoform X6 n=1 Tax=Culex quinquefasciatus TaxID=7176 RepID=UPI0018E32629|nr:gamma-aminobutyric acid receptor subunit alpha-4 isoform X6 [Culex quinquefasciatus]
MGFPCGEKAHPRTTSRPSEPSWNELPIGCEQQQQHLLLPTTTNTVNLSNLNSTSRKHQQTTFHRARTLQSKHPPPASAAFPEVSPSGFHYPFNLFHPFHDPASTATTTLQQYSTIILGKLSQFITNHVAARSGGGGGGSRSPELLLLPPWSPCTRHASDGPSVHSHDTGRSSPADAIGPSEKRHHSSTPVLTCEEAAGSNPRVIVPPESAPTTTCDPAATSVAYLGGCTESSSSPSSQSISPDAGLGDCCSNHPAKDRNDGNRQTTLTCGTETRTGRGTGTGTSDARPANTATTSTATATSSHYLVRHSLCLYAASSVILALCYLTIPTVASDTPHTIRGKTRFAEGKSDKEILDHLLKGSRYDKRLLPPVDDADFCCGMQTPEMAKHMPDTRVPGRPQNRGSLTVNVSVLLLSLASPDESSLKYEVEFLLQQQWYDPRLRYANQSSYEFLNAIHHHEDIWLPDTYFIMHGDFKDPIIPMHFALRIFRNGTINYLMRRHLILSCQGRLNIFPFDDPLCSFALESISYEQSAIRYVWKNDEDTLRKSPSLTTLNAYLIQNQTITCPIKASWRAEGQALSEEDEEFLCNLCQRRFEEQGNYSCLKVDLIFTRDRAFYFTTVFIPGIILVTSSFITFWLEWNAVPARSMIGVTTMLNFFTTSNGFRSTLPVVSNLTAMNVWDGVCMCFIYASLLEFVCVNYVGRKRPLHNVVYRPGENPVTQRLPAVLNRIGIILASPLTSRVFSETIENEFHMAIAAEKSTSANAAAAAATSAAATSAGTATSASAASPRATSRPASTIMLEEGLGDGGADVQPRGTIRRQPTVETKLNESGLMETSFKRESGGPNEIVACTSCAGGTSPCTHSANNGCATETCFVQVRKKEPPHPIRVAKTIDVIARITFPSAYAVFLIFFFIHYKGFS